MPSWSSWGPMQSWRAALGLQNGELNLFFPSLEILRIVSCQVWMKRLLHSTNSLQRHKFGPLRLITRASKLVMSFVIIALSWLTLPTENVLLRLRVFPIGNTARFFWKFPACHLNKFEDDLFAFSRRQWEIHEFPFIVFVCRIISRRGLLSIGWCRPPNACRSYKVFSI